jgi:hypothetical protein
MLYLNLIINDSLDSPGSVGKDGLCPLTGSMGGSDRAASSIIDQYSSSASSSVSLPEVFII